MKFRPLVSLCSLAAGAAIALAGCHQPATAPAANPATPAAAVPQPTAKPLYERLGGEPAITAVVDEFLRRVTSNDQIKKRFAGANVPHLRQMLIEQICNATGGPQKYTGGDMKTVHAGMGIKPAEFNALVGDLVGALDHFQVPAQEKQELLSALGGMQKDIVETGPTVAEKLDALEVRLMRIQLKLDEVNDRLALLEARGPAATAPAAVPPSPDQPVPPPVKVEIPLGKPIVTRPFSADEAKVFGGLVERLETAKAEPTADNQRPAWLGKPLEVTRFISSGGEVVDLKQSKGKKVLLVVLRGLTGNSVCIHCSAQTVALIKAAKKFEDRHTEVVIVYPGKAESVPAFIEATRSLDAEFQLPYKVLLDIDLLAIRMFDIAGSLAKPTSILLDEQGLVRYVYVGQQPADRPSVQALLDVIDGLPTK